MWWIGLLVAAVVLIIFLELVFDIFSLRRENLKREARLRKDKPGKHKMK